MIRYFELLVFLTELVEADVDACLTFPLVAGAFAVGLSGLAGEAKKLVMLDCYRSATCPMLLPTAANGQRAR